MPSTPADTYGLLRSAIRDPNPVVFVENRQLYGMKGPMPPDDHLVPIGVAALRRPGSDVTVVSWSRMVHDALQAAEQLAEESIDVEVIDLRTVAPIDLDTVAASVSRTGRLLIAHEAVQSGGIGGAGDTRHRAVLLRPRRPHRPVAPTHAPVPYAPSLERAWLPDAGAIAARFDAWHSSEPRPESGSVVGTPSWWTVYNRVGGTVTVTDFELDAKYRQTEGTILLTGIQALIRVAIDQHRADAGRGLRTATFISGYQGSPLGTLDLTIKRMLPLLAEHDIRWQPGINEDLAATAVWGTQQRALGRLARHDGVLGMWYGKGPGVDRCGDVFKHANFMGVTDNGGVLAVGGDDPGAKSSTLPTDSNPTFYDALMPILYPGTIQEVLDLGLHGYALSRYSGLWAGLKIVTNIADGLATAEVGPDRIAPIDPGLVIDGQPWRHVQRDGLLAPISLEQEKEIFYGRLEAAKAYAAANGINRIAGATGPAWLGIVASGRTYHEVLQALSDLGLTEDDLREHGVRLLRLGMIYPLEPSVVRAFASGLEEILVIEEKRPFVEMFVRDILYPLAERPRVVGKQDAEGRLLVPADGELTADRLAPLLGRRLGARLSSAVLEARLALLESAAASVHDPLTARKPFFCSGCPHNRSTTLPDGSVVGGGVGCHAMVLWMDRDAVSISHMGGEGAQWIGRRPLHGPAAHVPEHRRRHVLPLGEPLNPRRGVG